LLPLRHPSLRLNTTMLFALRRSIHAACSRRWAASAKPLRTLTLLGCAWILVIGLFALPQASLANLPPGDAVTNSRALLRYALPIDSPEMRKIQKELEDISYDLRGSKRWSSIHHHANQSEKLLNKNGTKILAAVSEANRASAEALIGDLKTGLVQLNAAADIKDKSAIWDNRRALLNQVGQLEELMIGGLGFELPEEYRNLPYLKGRATVLLSTSQGEVTLVVDGYNAPITAGNFVDLVQRGFYDGLPFTRADESYVLQAGDPDGPAEGFIDPKTKQMRKIPFEVRVEGKSQPEYGNTLEDLGLFNALPVLPFSAYGTVGLARPNEDVNAGSSQFFFFLFEPEMTPAGLNLIDGRYAAFGYVVEGEEVLKQMLAGDQIISAKVLAGGENLVQPS
jgi:peptidylprolyl isomerase